MGYELKRSKLFKLWKELTSVLTKHVSPVDSKGFQVSTVGEYAVITKQAPLHHPALLIVHRDHVSALCGHLEDAREVLDQAAPSEGLAPRYEEEE